MRRFRRGHILKADGVAEPFSTAKVLRCLRHALADADGSEVVAKPLADAVSIHFRRCVAGAVPNTAKLFESVCVVLAETGHEEAAERLRCHRIARQRLRTATRVLVRGASGIVSAPWAKARIVGAVQRVHGLTRETARMIAAGAEARLLSIGYRRLASELVDQIVKHELASWGFVSETAPVEPGGESEPTISYTDTKEDSGD